MPSIYKVIGDKFLKTPITGKVPERICACGEKLGVPCINERADYDPEHDPHALCSETTDHQWLTHRPEEL